MNSPPVCEQTLHTTWRVNFFNNMSLNFTDEDDVLRNTAPFSRSSASSANPASTTAPVLTTSYVAPVEVDQWAKPPMWTKDAVIALLQEVGNHGANTPGYRETQKRFDSVVQALQSRGYLFSNARVAQHKFNDLLAEYKRKMNKRGAESGVEV